MGEDEPGRQPPNWSPRSCDWLEGLPTAQFATVAFSIDLLAEQGPLLGEPYTRQLDGKLRELRLHLDRQSVRVSYWIAPGRRIVQLTVFVQRRQQETREIARAKRAMDRCMAQVHTTDEEEDDGWTQAVERGPRRADGRARGGGRL